MITSVLFLIAFLLIHQWMRKPKNFPPGPTRWPFIGNIFDLKSTDLRTYEAIEKVAQKYGEVCGLYVGGIPIVVVSGTEAIREVLSKPELQGRPITTHQRSEKRRIGIANIDGEVWKEQRHFLVQHLKKLGMGTGAIETAIHEGVEDIIQEIKLCIGSTSNKSVEVRELFSGSGANLIYYLIAGKRFKPRDPVLLRLVKTTREIVTLVNPSSGLLLSMPILVRIFPSLTTYQDFLRCRDTIFSILQEEIEAHQKAQDEDNPNNTIIGMYLQEIEKRKAPSSFHMEQLLLMLLELFAAASESTSGTMAFAFLYMVLYPNIQTRVQMELDEVVGRDRLPSLRDRAKLVYTEATLNELYRHSSVVPLAMPHAVLGSEDVEFKGYLIPKNARVIINLHGLHHDRKYWRDPENFCPERFLDDQGCLRRDTGLIAFGLGKRSCIGESMAKDNVFLTFAAILQKFTIRVPDGDPVPSTVPEGGLGLTTQPFKVKMTPRLN